MKRLNLGFGLVKLFGKPVPQNFFGVTSNTDNFRIIALIIVLIKEVGRGKKKVLAKVHSASANGSKNLLIVCLTLSVDWKKKLSSSY